MTTTIIPDIAISVRQPWAWAIIYANKDMENRTAKAISFMVPLRGRKAIHAAKGMTREEYESARDFMAELGITCPPPAELQRGGIIGSVEVVDQASFSTSPWFLGPRALVLRNPRPTIFTPSVGALGYFKWKPADASIVPEAALWMLPPPPPSEPLPLPEPTPAALPLFDRT